MNLPAITFSDDQAEAHDRVAGELMASGIDLDHGALGEMPEGRTSVLAVMGKAGSGKTMLLASLYKDLREAGVEIISDIDKAPFIAAMAPVYAKHAGTPELKSLVERIQAVK